MSINITMPALSPTMEDGTLAKWHVKEGDTVAAGDVIAEIETDKATMEVEAVDEGTIGKILVAEGSEGVKVNAVIAVLLEEGESAGDSEAAEDAGDAGDASSETKGRTVTSANDENGGKAETTDRTQAATDRESFEADAVERVSNGIEDARAKAANAGPSPAREDGERIFASPLARRLAREGGIDLSALVGSGPKGRIVKADIEKAQAEGVPAASGAVGGAAPAGAAAPAAELATGMTPDEVRALYEQETYETLPLDAMRRVVAARLTEAKQTVPHFYLSLDCRIDALLWAREEINAKAPEDKDGKPAYKLSVNDFVVKAWAAALQRVPAANATWAGDSVLLHKHSDVAVAVAVPGGLFTPVIRRAERKSLTEISAEMRDLARRARSKKLAPHEYRGGTSAVSNLGMYGITNFAAVINPPHGTILAVGVGEERVYADKGEIRTGHFMTVTLSCDHRAVDGALGAELLGAFKALIETPVMMLA